MLLINVKSVINKINKNGLRRKMNTKETNIDLVLCTEFFIPERKVNLVLNIHQYNTVEMEMGVPQG